MRLRRSTRRAPDENPAVERLELDDPSEEYIGVVEVLIPGGGEEVWAADPASGRFQALPSVLAAILQRIGRFRTLTGHRRALLEAGWQYDGSGYFESAFRELVERGLLRSKSAFLAAATQAAATEAAGAEPAAAPVSTVGWITRDRRSSLLRSVESYAANLREYGRQADLAVYDDSADPGERKRTRTALAEITESRGIRVRYIGQEEKRELAEALLRAGKGDGLPPEVVEFALFDPQGLGYTVGANTNALLLDTAGQTMLLLNDDVECRFGAPPWGDVGGLALSSATDPTARRLFADRSALETAVQWREVDILGAHQSLLGRQAGACIQEQGDSHHVRCEDMTVASLRALEGGAARVRVTMTGLCGDSGMGYPVFALFLDGESRLRLLVSEEHFRSAVRSRLVLRAVAAPTLSDSGFLMAASCGLDNRELLPPLFPVLRNSDGLFGHTLRLCIPGALIGHLPLATAHFPPEHREFTEGEASQVAPPRLADLLILLIRRLVPVADRSSAGALRQLGDGLLAVAGAEGREFQALAREAWAAEMSRHVAELERLLVAWDGQPDFWAEEAAARIEAAGREVTSNRAFVPSDLDGPAADPVEAAALAQTLVGRYGELLRWWPALVAAAQVVRSGEKGVSPPL